MLRHQIQLAAAVGLFFFLASLINAGAWLMVRLGWRCGSARDWQRRVGALCRVWRWLAIHLGVLRLRVERGEVFEELEGVVVAANHPCLLDAFVLLGLVPRAVCVMRAGLRKHPALGPLARLADYLPNDRGPALVRAGQEKLRMGMNLVVFPEGTRSEGLAPGRFKPGFALTAAMAGAPVLPVGIRYHGMAFRKGRSLLAPAALPGEMVVVPGERIWAREGEGAREFARRVRAECERLCS